MIWSEELYPSGQNNAEKLFSTPPIALEELAIITLPMRSEELVKIISITRTLRVSRASAKYDHFGNKRRIEGVSWNSFDRIGRVTKISFDQKLHGMQDLGLRMRSLLRGWRKDVFVVTIRAG